MVSLARRFALPVLALPLLCAGGCELMGASPRATASDVWEKTYELGTSPRLAISNTNGSVTVSVHDASTVTVRAERTVRAVTEQGARELLAATAIDERVQGASVSLTTRRPSSFGRGQQAQVRYDVKVPRDASLGLRTTNGAVSVDGVQGRVELETVNGRVRGTALGQVQRAETVNGSVELVFDELPAQDAAIETVNGSVNVTLPRTAGAALTVRTVNGSITVSGFAAVTDEGRRRRSYEGTLNGGGPRLRVETVNGSVTVRGQGAGTD